MTDADHSMDRTSRRMKGPRGLRDGEIRVQDASVVELREGGRTRRRWATSQQDVYAELVDGTYQLDLTKVYGQPGIPYSGGGRITLERNPAYSPVKVRGLRGNPGEYWSLQSHPQVIRHLRTSVDAVVAAGVRLEECPLPDRLKGDPEAIRRRDLIHDLCQHHLDAWSSVDPEEDDLDHFLWHLLWVPAVCGFGWWEYTAQKAVVDFALYQRGAGAWGQPTKTVSRAIPRAIWQMDLPRFRAPWTVTRWLTQAEKLLGIECDFSRVSDYPSGRTGRSQVIVPRSKFLLVCHERLGSNYEGRSILRDAGEWIRLDRRATAGEGLGIETSVTGDVIVEEPENTGLTDAEAGRVDDWFDNRTAQAGNGLRVPHGTKVHLLNPKDTTPDVSAQSERYQRQIALCLGGEHALIALQKAGSYAARSDASADARAAYGNVFKKSVARPLRQVFAAIVRANDPEGWAKGHRWLPNIVGGGAEHRDAKEALEPYVMLLQAGAVQPNPDDEAWARDAAGMPARREEAQDAPVGATLGEAMDRAVQRRTARAVEVMRSNPSGWLQSYRRATADPSQEAERIVSEEAPDLKGDARDDLVGLVEGRLRSIEDGVAHVMDTSDDPEVWADAVRGRVADVAGDIEAAVASAKARSGATYYRWETAGDSRVRDDHKALDGQVFGPEGHPVHGHPGESYGCRCKAVPVEVPR